jgi:iron complex transport system substrate-binding protein
MKGLQAGSVRAAAAATLAFVLAAPAPAAASAKAAAPSVSRGPSATTAVPRARAPIDIVDDRGRTVRLAAPARRIISLLPSLTEVTCALDACDRLVGVDRFSNWPAQVEQLPRLGGLEDAQVERIVSLKPDLVLAAASARVVDRLESLSIPVLALEPKTLAGTRRAIGAVAAALGEPAAGEKQWRALSTRIEAASRRVPASMRGQRVYFEVSSAPHAAGAGSFVGDVLALLDMENIVPASMGVFPRLNPEYVVRAQPQLILGSEAGLRDMPKRPGWAGLPALRNRRTCAFPPAAYDVLVRPGPRLGEAADLLVDCLVALDKSGR